MSTKTWTPQKIEEASSWIVPPACQGQIVEVSYGEDHAGSAFKRVFDRSDRSTNYYVAEIDECGCASECDCWDPANYEPEGFSWVRVED